MLYLLILTSLSCENKKYNDYNRDSETEVIQNVNKVLKLTPNMQIGSLIDSIHIVEPEFYYTLIAEKALKKDHILFKISSIIQEFQNKESANYNNIEIIISILEIINKNIEDIKSFNDYIDIINKEQKISINLMYLVFNFISNSSYFDNVDKVKNLKSHLHKMYNLEKNINKKDFIEYIDNLANANNTNELMKKHSNQCIVNTFKTFLFMGCKEKIEILIKNNEVTNILFKYLKDRQDEEFFFYNTLFYSVFYAEDCKFVVDKMNIIFNNLNTIVNDKDILDKFKRKSKIPLLKNIISDFKEQGDLKKTIQIVNYLLENEKEENKSSSMSSSFYELSEFTNLIKEILKIEYDNQDKELESDMNKLKNHEIILLLQKKRYI
jgi:hypothetical protein